MTETEPRTGRPCGGDVAAYALGALEPAEAEAFRRHLDTCAVCRDELAAFQEVVNALPLSAPAHRAPSSVRRRVLREVAGDSRATGDRPRARRFGAGLALVPRPVLAVGTVLAAAVIVFLGVQLGSSSGARRPGDHAQVTGQGSAQLRIVHGHASLVVRHFAQPPAGKIYEVWVKRGSGSPSPTSALFSVTSSGNGDVDVPGSLHGVSVVMVTPEPAGGSRVPTHAPVITVPLT